MGRTCCPEAEWQVQDSMMRAGLSTRDRNPRTTRHLNGTGSCLGRHRQSEHPSRGETGAAFPLPPLMCKSPLGHFCQLVRKPLLRKQQRQGPNHPTGEALPHRDVMRQNGQRRYNPREYVCEPQFHHEQGYTQIMSRRALFWLSHTITVLLSIG